MRNATKEEMKSVHDYIDSISQTLLSIPIPKNATNGDVIKAMFPNAEIRFMVNLSDMHSVRVKFGDNTYLYYDDHTFSREWWDAPYKTRK